MKKYIALLLCLLSIGLMFTSCADDDDDVPTRVLPDNIVNLEDSTNNNPDLNINNAWSDNYYAMFTYYCPSQGYSNATVISERKTQDSFIITNPMDNSFKYYVNSEAGIDEYAVNPEKQLFSYNFHQGKVVNRDINSMFMNISFVSENFTKGKDVVYTGTESVADRNCWMYLQRTYNAEGQVEKVAYIWIDAVYGFCSKSIVYSGGSVVCSWELQDFSVGTVTDADITPDLSQYDFTGAQQ